MSCASAESGVCVRLCFMSPFAPGCMSEIQNCVLLISWIVDFLKKCHEKRLITGQGRHGRGTKT